MFNNRHVVVLAMVASLIGATLQTAAAQAPSPNAFATIQGNAANPTDGVMANATVRLRNVRTGRVVREMKTDKTGLFKFQGVEPGSYVVELMDQNGVTQVASHILNVNAGDIASAALKLPFRVPPLARVFGQSSTPSAGAVIAAAAASGVLANTVTGQPSSAR